MKHFQYIHLLLKTDIVRYILLCMVSDTLLIYTIQEYFWWYIANFFSCNLCSVHNHMCSNLTSLVEHSLRTLWHSNKVLPSKTDCNEMRLAHFSFWKPSWFDHDVNERCTLKTSYHVFHIVKCVYTVLQIIIAMYIVQCDFRAHRQWKI